MAISRASWDGAASNYKDTNAYCSACLIDLNDPGADKVQAKCKLPIKEPGGATNANAVHAAAAALAGGRGGVDAPPADKKAAARKLIAAYQEMKEDAPPSLKSLAS